MMQRNASQRGTTLVIVLIFLVLLSLFAISAFNSSSGTLRIVGNSQAHQESLSAAQMAVEQVISTSQFHKDPVAVTAAPVSVDIDGSGSADYAATVQLPECIRAKPILNIELPPASKSGTSDLDPYRDCRGSFEGDCVNMEWSVTASVSDPRTRTQVAVTQGVGVVDFVNEVPDACK